MPQRLSALLALLLALLLSTGARAGEDAGLRLREWQEQAGIAGLAVAFIEDGEVRQLHVLGRRHAQRPEPLDADTVMYGASLTKTVFALLVLQLVDEGRLDLDRPLEKLLPRPLPEYGPYADLAELDPEQLWRRLTPRILLAHGGGLLNFRWLDSDQRLRFHAAPGSAYHYSGEGINLLQFALERGLGLDIEAELQRRFFQPLGLTRTSLRWNPDWLPNVADGHAADGSIRAHARRGNVRAAGSMDSSPRDQARLWAAVASGWGLSPASRAALVAAQQPIRARQQFPTFGQPEDPALAAIGFAAGLGVVRLDEPDGTLWFKGGHDDYTGNQLVCHDGRRRCVLMMSNDVRAEALYPRIAALWLGQTRLPWRWEYPNP